MNPETNTLKVIVKQVYGNDTLYPACDVLKAYVAAQGQKTITHRDIRILKILGFKLIVAQPEVSL